MMFSRWFGRKQAYVEHKTPASGIRLLGEPTGSGLELLRTELAKILAAEANTSRAYLSKVQYAGEDQVRVALVIDGRAPAQVMAPRIAGACEPLVAIDLLFLESLPGHLVTEIERTLRPFYADQEA